MSTGKGLVVSYRSTQEMCWLGERVDLHHRQIQCSLQFLMTYLKFSNPLAGFARLIMERSTFEHVNHSSREVGQVFLL